MGKYSAKSVNFSSPPGADPLGIGVPDLGRSSYDPIQTIREGWATHRENALIDRDRRDREKEQYIQSMPDYKTTNANLSGMLNKDLIRLGEIATKKADMGDWFGTAKNEEGKKLSMEMADIENRMATYGPIVSELDNRVKEVHKAIVDPNIQDQIDLELTKEVMENAANVKDYDEAARVLPTVQPVFKPKPQDIIGYAKKIGSMIEGTDLQNHNIQVDPISGTLTTTTVTGADPKQVHKAYQTGYQMAPPNMKNAIKRMYEAAPDKNNADGIPLGEQEWFANKFSGFHGTTTSTKTTKLPKSDQQKPTGLGIGLPRDDSGRVVISDAQQPMVISTDITTPGTTKRGLFGFGKIKEDKPESTRKEDQEYNSVAIPLTGIDEVFDTLTPADAIDTSTGKAPEGRTNVASHKAASVNFMPTYQGEAKTIKIPYTDKEGNQKFDVFKLEPGKPVPKSVEEELQNQKEPFNYEPYLVTQSVYGAAMDQKNIGSLSWNDYVSKHGKTILTPWESINRSFMAKMQSEDYQLQQLEQDLADVYSQLNNIDDIVQ